MLKATIDGKTVELKPDQIEMPQGYALITPDSVPSGYLKQEAVDRIVSDRVTRAKTTALSEAIENQDFHSQVLAKYNITLENGKPKGVETANIDELKKQITLQTRAEVESEYKPKVAENRTLKGRVLRSELESAALKLGVKPDLLPLISRSYSEEFGIDKDGSVYLKDGNGFKIDGSGQYVTPEKWLAENKNKGAFPSFFNDAPQRGGSGAGQANGTSYTGNQKKSDFKTVVDKTRFIRSFGQEAYDTLPT
jgi:hypothetical protein